ncbi:MAG: hypothetical protein RDU14_15220 [Melioribacteraceae bacterium]|nr:hypothetical protein [Melioribacteraceae bacterium]
MQDDKLFFQIFYDIKEEIHKIKDINHRLEFIDTLMKDIDWKLKIFSDNHFVTYFYEILAYLELNHNKLNGSDITKYDNDFLVGLKKWQYRETNKEIKLLINHYYKILYRALKKDREKNLKCFIYSLHSQISNDYHNLFNYYRRIAKVIQSELYFNRQLLSIRIKNRKINFNIINTAEKVDLKTNPKLPAERLRLTPNKKEILNSKIVEEVNNFIYAGKGSQEQAFAFLSKKSRTLFEYNLTPKQIEGRYSRNKKKHY